MKASNYGIWVLAGAVLLVGALLADVEPATIAPLLFLLVCPLMMLVMMKGMHGGGGHEDHREEPREDPQDDQGRHAKQENRQ